MKDCPAGEAISRYLDGELEAGEAARLEVHFEACPRCRREAERLDRAGEILRLAAAGGSRPPACLDRMIEEKYFPGGEACLGVIEFDLSRPSGSVRDQAAEPPAAYRPGRKVLTGPGIEASVELFRDGEGSASFRVGVRDREGKPLEGARLRLEREGKTVWSFLTRGRDEPVIPRLLPGRYRLRIERGPDCFLVLDLR